MPDQWSSLEYFFRGSLRNALDIEPLEQETEFLFQPAPASECWSQLLCQRSAGFFYHHFSEHETEQ